MKKIKQILFYTGLVLSSVVVVVLASACVDHPPKDYTEIRTLAESAANDGSFSETVTFTDFEIGDATYLGFLPVGLKLPSPIASSSSELPSYEPSTFESQVLPFAMKNQETLLEGTHFSVTSQNTPEGITVNVSMDGAANRVKVTLSGKAVKNSEADNVNLNLDFTYNTYALSADRKYNLFSKSGSLSRKTIEIQFSDNQETPAAPSLAYSNTSFSENNTNAGGISETSTITVTGDTFAIASGDFTAGTHYTISEVPAGLTPVLTRTSDTTATLSFSGNASTHGSSSSVSGGATLTFLAAAFSKGVAPIVGQVLSIDFKDHYTLNYSATTLNESDANAGGITESIDVTLSNDTFVAGPFVASTHYTISNVPAGLSAVFTRTSNTTALLSLTGNAASHAAANSIANLNLTFLAAAFSGGVAPSDGTQSKNFSIAFRDPSNLVYSVTTLNENNSNVGGISETATVTLSNDTFVAGPFVASTHYTVSNVPAGLTAVLTRSSATTATLSFTGAATSHQSADDVSNVTLTFLGAAFTTGVAPSNGSQTQAFTLNFGDSYMVLYTAGTTYTGNLGGRVGADAACASGKPANYPANAKAFISVSSADEIQDMPSLYGVPTSQPIQSLSGTALASDWANLLDGDIDSHLLAAGFFVFPTDWWSGSNFDGSINANSCVNWTDDTNSNTGRIGVSTDASVGWITGGSASCDNTAAVLCIAYE